MPSAGRLNNDYIPSQKRGNLVERLLVQRVGGNSGTILRITGDEENVGFFIGPPAANLVEKSHRGRCVGKRG